jgi:hypothetical protein
MLGAVSGPRSIHKLASTAPMPKQDQFCDSRHFNQRYQTPSAIDARQRHFAAGFYLQAPQCSRLAEFGALSGFG